MHTSAMEFASHAVEPGQVRGKRVLEAGAYNVNGSVRPVIEAMRPASYVGTDMREGPGVDLVCAAEDLPTSNHVGKDSADVVISTEMLEHAADWAGAMRGMIAVLAPGGYLVLTTRGPGFPPHGFPDDHWRFTPEMMADVITAARLRLLRCEPDPDPASPGVFVLARKPGGWKTPRGLLGRLAAITPFPVPK